MNSFYILLISVFFAGAIIGFFAGFKRISFLLIKTGISVSAIYFLSPYITFLFSGDMPLSIEWLKVITYATFFVVVFIIAHWLLQPIANRFIHFNKTKGNKILGLLTGAISMLIASLIFIQLTDIVEMPSFVLYKDNTEYGTSIQQQPVRVMGSGTSEGITENGVWLAFTENNFIRDRILEKNMLLLVNRERLKHGLKPFLEDAVLQDAATKHAADMFSRGYFSHNTPEGDDPFERLRKMKISYRYAGENLAMAPSLIKAHDGLMKSPGHRANILNPSYKRIGIAVLDGGVHGLMITQEFRN